MFINYLLDRNNQATSISNSKIIQMHLILNISIISKLTLYAILYYKIFKSNYAITWFYLTLNFMFFLFNDRIV